MKDIRLLNLAVTANKTKQDKKKYFRNFDLDLKIVQSR